MRQRNQNCKLGIDMSEYNNDSWLWPKERKVIWFLFPIMIGQNSREVDQLNLAQCFRSSLFESECKQIWDYLFDQIGVNKLWIWTITSWDWELIHPLLYIILRNGLINMFLALYLVPFTQVFQHSTSSLLHSLGYGTEWKTTSITYTNQPSTIWIRCSKSSRWNICILEKRYQEKDEDRDNKIPGLQPICRLTPKHGA